MIGLGSGILGVATGMGVAGALGGGFWAGMAGAIAGGVVSGFAGSVGQGLSAGIDFGSALSGATQGIAMNAALSAATYAVSYGAYKGVKAIKGAGVKTPVGQQGQGSASSSLNTNKGETASNSQALSSRGTEDSIDLGTIKVTSKATGYRYVGPGEAGAAANTGYVPNTTETGAPKTVFYTPDEPLNSASQAIKTYNLEGVRTHRIGLDTTKTTNIYGGNVEGGSGIEMATDQKIPVVDIQKLKQ